MKCSPYRDTMQLMKEREGEKEANIKETGKKNAKHPDAKYNRRVEWGIKKENTQKC